LRMSNSRTARQATQWELRDYKRKPGRPRKRWVGHQTRPQTDGLDLGRSQGTGEQQSRMAQWINAAIWMRDELRSMCSYLS